MKYYPAYLDIRNRRCLVVGGGGVGTRKVKTLLDCGAHVTIISPQISRQLIKLADNNRVSIKKRSYQSGDLESIFLVISATDDEKLNRQISRDAEKRGLLCNIADRPEICNFILPSVVHRGDLTISISTAGRSPAMAKKLRQDLEKQYGEEYADFLRLMGAIRQKLLSQAHEPEAHKSLFEQLINNGLLELIREHRIEEINSLLQTVLGEGYRYEALMDE
jgi:precorrin-2 dehydrogenase/sirohydrochlorin ferrochelatase